MFDIVNSFVDKGIVELTPMIAWQFKNSVMDNNIVSEITGSGTVIALNGKGVLKTITAAGSSAKIRTTVTLVPNPVARVLVKFDAIFTTGVSGSTQIIGIGDESNGFFFGYNGVSFGILHRKDGAELWIPSANWNQAPNIIMEGGVVFDPTKGNNYSIAYQNSAFGNVQFALEHPTDGSQIVVHQISYLNTYTEPKIYNPNLPLMAKVSNNTNNTNIMLQTTTAAAFIEGASRSVLSAQINSALGNLYSTTTGIINVLKSNYLVVQITNPSGSGKTAYIQRASGGTTGSTSCDVLKDATFTAAGTSIPPSVLNLGLSDNSIIAAKYISQATDPSIGGKNISSIVNLGGVVVTEFGGSIIVPGGHTLLMRIKNISEQTNSVCANLTWVELLN
ncbi:hypothetical protein [Clostridium sp.]